MTQTKPDEQERGREDWQAFGDTKAVPDGYWVNRRGETLHMDRSPGYPLLRWATGGGFAGGLADELRPATPDEIAAFDARREAIDQQQHEGREREAELLGRYGLTHADFVRFRSCYEEEGALVVETRENGVGATSVDAIRKGNLLDTFPDESDSTYQYYRFALPAAPAAERARLITDLRLHASATPGNINLPGEGDQVAVYRDTFEQMQRAMSKAADLLAAPAAERAPQSDEAVPINPNWRRNLLLAADAAEHHGDDVSIAPDGVRNLVAMFDALSAECPACADAAERAPRVGREDFSAYNAWLASEEGQRLRNSDTDTRLLAAFRAGEEAAERALDAHVSRAAERQSGETIDEGEIRFLCFGCEGWFAENEVTHPGGEYHCGETVAVPRALVGYVQQLQDVLREQKQIRRAAERASGEPVAVGGSRLERTLADFTRSAMLRLEEQQAKPNPDTALIAVLADAVRLAREYEDALVATPSRGPVEQRDERLPSDAERCQSVRFAARCWLPLGHEGDHRAGIQSWSTVASQPVGEVRDAE